jgi:hypothetical protein
MKFTACLAIALLGCFCPRSVNAQEVKYIDLTAISQRTALRYPPAPPNQCDGQNHCVGGGSVGVGIADGAPDWRDPHALGVYVLSVSPNEIKPAEPLEIEFKVLNTGLAVIEVPASPHLSDLQTSDSSPFKYSSLALAVRVQGEHPSCVPCLGYVQLYGARDGDGSTVSLRPGEWIRVKAKVAFPQGLTGMAQLRGEFWLRENTFTPHTGGGFTTIVNLTPNVTPTPTVAVRFLPQSGKQGQSQP